MLENGLARGNDKRFFNGMTAAIYGNTPEAHIKCLLLQFLQCYDLTEAERMEAIELLQMAQTALTPAQRKKIWEKLDE